MSTNNIEIESKVLLTKSNYDKIIKELDFPKISKVQTNYYLDSHDQILKHYGMILRVRQGEQKFIFTLKAPLSEGLLEKNQTLSTKEAEDLIDHNIFPDGEIKYFLETLHISHEELSVLATLTTSRKETTYNNTTLDISQNTYGDKVDYELECDSESELKSQSTLKEICDKFKIKFELNTISKEDRAITASLQK